jgi:hypothetical protein
LIVSLSGTNLPGVPVNTSATFTKRKEYFILIKNGLINKLGKVEKENVEFYEHEQQLIYHHQIIHPYPK